MHTWFRWLWSMVEAPQQDAVDALYTTVTTTSVSPEVCIFLETFTDVEDAEEARLLYVDPETQELFLFEYFQPETGEWHPVDVAWNWRDYVRLGGDTSVYRLILDTHDIHTVR